MRTYKHLRRLGGPDRQVGDGPLGSVARHLVAQFDADETEKLRRAQARAEFAGQGPIFDVLQKLAAQVSQESLENVQAPMIMRFDAHKIMRTASQASPSDRGLHLAARHVEALWRQLPTGNFSVGEVAQIRKHFQEEFPKSAVARTIDTKFPELGFQTLDVRKLSHLASQVTDEESYHAIIAAHGLTDQRHPGQMRARAFIRGLVNMADDEARAVQAGGEAAASRALTRFAQEDMPMGPMEDDMPPVEEEVPHEESTEEMTTIESPVTGEELVLELGISDEDMGEEVGEGDLDIAPDDVEGLDVIGQLEDMMGEEDELDEEDSDLPMPGGEETQTTIEDPSSGQTLEVHLVPVEEDEGEEPLDNMPLGSEPAADTAFDMNASSKCGKCGMMWKKGESKCSGCGYSKEASRGRRFAVYAVTAGQRADEPLERFRARSMRHALRHIANHGVKGEVRSPSGELDRHALVVLDPLEGNFIYVRAEQSEFDPSINEQQPAQMSIDQSDGKKVLMSEEEIGQPRATMDVPHITHKETVVGKEAKVSKSAALQICAKVGVSPAFVEDQILSGNRVASGRWAIEFDDNDQIIVSRDGNTKRTASLWETDDVISDFMMYLAQDMVSQRQAQKTTPKPSPSYELRALFDLGCRRCGAIDEFLMPDEPIAAKCASCENVISPQEIGHRIAQIEDFDSFVLTTDIPNPKSEDFGLNARRLLAAIRAVVPGVEGNVDGTRLRVQLRRASERQLNRVRKVLEDQFGVRSMDSVRSAATPVVTPAGTPAQHATVPAAVPQGQPEAGGPTYVGPPPAPMNAPAQPQVNPAQPAATGTPAQQQMMQDANIPMTARWVVQARNRGVVVESLVDASDAATAKQLYQRINRGHEIVRVAQLGEEMPAEEMPPEDPGAEMGAPPSATPTPGGMVGMEAPGLMGSGQLDQETQDAIMAALTHYRNMGMGVVEAIADFQNNYRELLDTYGSKESPERHMMEGQIIALAGEVYKKPGLMTEASLRTAEESGSEFDPKINEQQDDAVSLGEGDEVLGPDSETDSSANSSLEPSSINEQVDTVADQAGASGSNTDQQSDTETNDPGSFGAYSGEGPKVQHPVTDQKGVSMTDKSLGKDSDTGESQGGATKSWDSTSDRANTLQMQRSKAGARLFRLPEE